MNIDFKKLLKPYKNESIENLASWIKINSVDDPNSASKEYPFGIGVENALKFIAELGQKEGFNVDRCDNYCTEISFGEGKLISVFAHADVVPATGKWNHDPFGAVIEKNIMYGRGTSDDKGPAMAAFYALKALKDNNLIDGYKVSLVIGGNEEKGGRCLDYYFNKLNKPAPLYGFTPDADFPLIYGEKGIGGYVHKYHLNSSEILNIQGGIAVNSVIDEAKAVVKKNSLLKENAANFFTLLNVKYAIVENDSFEEITVYGKSAHGSIPHYGLNAGLILLKFLGFIYKDEHLSQLAECYLETTGKKMNTYYESEYLHNTTYNVGVISTKDNELSLYVNFRYPENVNLDEVKDKINSLNLGSVDKIYGGEPLLFDPKSKLVSTLLKVYQEETGDLETPIKTIGGGTYAKECKNTIAFGSAFPGRNDKIHEPDEEIHLDDFLKSQSIYARAIYELGKLK